MEPNRKTGVSQNCFSPTGADQKAVVENDIYLYDEAEPLMYACSETSMPPTSAGNIPALKCAEIAATGGASPIGLTKSRRKTRKSSTMVYESAGSPIRSPRSADGANLSKDMASIFKSEILSKFKEFAITPNSSCSTLKVRPKSVGAGGVGANTKSKSRENKIENISRDVEELFIHRAKFFTSSSENDRVRISSDGLQDEEFSTGMSDMDEGANGTGNVKRKSEEKARASLENINTSGLPRWIATKSIVEHDARIESPAARASPSRIGPPVQGRLSLRNMKTPCFCLLQEIRKNNLVMKEDIISSSSQTAGGFLNTHRESAGRSRSVNGSSKDEANNHIKLRDMGMTNTSTKQRISSGSVNGKTNVTQPVEVFEATGGEEKGVDVKANRKQGAIVRQDPATFEITEKSKQLASSYTPENDLQPLGTSEMTLERQSSVQMNDYLEAKMSTPNRRPEKYIKLPGLAEAFVRRDSIFKDIRIKDGTSFESVNALEEMSSRNMANQIRKMKNMKEYEDMSMRNIFDKILELERANIPRLEEHETTQPKLKTKDATTDLRIPLVNTKTQTGDSDKIMVDSFVQCESHIVDEANGRNIVRNDHQEIMVCNDNGDGVQLYNKLGHPLTDMDGYLLKDSLGRFLVRLDQYGIPISCTNGQGIFMEDSTAWDVVKNTLSIVHQSRKKLTQKRKRSKARPSLRQLETAMKNLKDTLEWADKIALDSSRANSLNQITAFDPAEHSSLRKPKLDTTKLNNTTSLITEMKSIAQLRNTLLEKVNFIVDNKNKLGKSENFKFLRKTNPLKNPQEPRDWSNPTSLRQGQDRPYSPTYQAARKLQGSESKNQAGSWMNFGLTQDLPTCNNADGHRGNIGLDWRSSVGGKSVGDDFSSKKKAGGHQKKIGTDWTNAISGDNLNGDYHTMKKLDGNVSKEGVLWDFTNHKSKDTYSSDEFPIWRTNGFGASNEDLLSDMRLVSKDTDLPRVSNLKTVNPKNSPITGSQLLVSLEKEYNLRFDDSWTESWKNEPLKGLPDRTEQARKWSEKRPSVEFSSGSMNQPIKRPK